MTAPQVDRQEPPLIADERPMLDAWLDYHRDTLLMKCAGLSDDQLKTRSAEPSSLSLLGLVRHMTDVERGWFRRGVAQESGPDVAPIYYSEDRPDGDFDSLDDTPVPEVFARFQSEIDKCRAAAANVPLDRVVQRRDEKFSVRWIYTHMIEEYARHNGHADLLRERIDGAVGD
ncbi:MAG TPA: DinB family protein [Chloroflexota bacterium]|nr:DinB family protein [Chloroflexota bacterium]